MNNNKNLIISLILILFAFTFVLLVKTIDVQAIGVNNTPIGFATLNQFIFNVVGVNILWYHVTDWLGIIPIFLSFIYAIIGVIQFIKRKSLLKVDKEILLLGVFYAVLILVYILFEKCIVNYRPILMNGFLEASFPSSHTLMAASICGSSIIVNKRLFKNKLSKLSNILSLIIIIVTILGRLISGVHWFTDILGGLIISLALLSTFYAVLQKINKEKV